MITESYVIETSTKTPISVEGFKPRRKVGLIINGMRNRHPESFEMIADLLVQRGYDYITAIREAHSHPFCLDIVSHYKRAVERKLEELRREITSDDVLFTAIIGASVRAQGVISIPLHYGETFTAYELREALSKMPVHHAVHYMSPDEHAGELAQIVATAEHPDLGSRHIAIAPTTPDVAQTLFPHKRDDRYGTAEVVTPFHRCFFDLADKPTLDRRFREAAIYQREYRPESAYMRHGSVQPREVAFTR